MEKHGGREVERRREREKARGRKDEGRRRGREKEPVPDQSISLIVATPLTSHSPFSGHMDI